MKEKVLLVEDEDALAQVLSIKLEREGFTVFRAKDGEEGLEVATREHPDVILLDIIMPKMDGLTMLSRLRKDGGEWGKSAKVMMLTNLSDGDSVMKSLNEAAFDYLVKSDWKLEDIVEKIRERLTS